MGDRFEVRHVHCGMVRRYGLWDMQKDAFALQPEYGQAEMEDEAGAWNEQYARALATAKSEAAKARYRAYMG